MDRSCISSGRNAFHSLETECTDIPSISPTGNMLVLGEKSFVLTRLGSPWSGKHVGSRDCSTPPRDFPDKSLNEWTLQENSSCTDLP